jgi:hypothetical protein
MRTILLSGALLIFLVVIGCSGGTSLVTPSGNGTSGIEIKPLTGSLGVGVADYLPDGSPASGMGLMGLYTLAIDPVNSTAELTPIRNGALTDVLEVVDITNFLSLAPCTDCAKMKSISLDADGNPVISIGIKHPFDCGDPLKPVTGKNRADLHVFNVEGIIVSNADGTSFPGIGKTIAGFELKSADGYTGYLDQVLEDILPTAADIHPYILHFDDYSEGNYAAGNPMGFESVTSPPPSGNLVMAMGSEYNYQDYVFANLPSEPVEFIFAVGCTYAVSASSKAMRFSPEYRVPQHCKKAASEVRVEIVTNNMLAGDPASSAELAIKVLDINHGVAVGENLDEMLADSSVGEISIEVPGVTASPVVQTSFTPTGNGRDPNDPLVFPMTITNSASAGEGTYAGLVKVTDTYTPGLNTSPLLNGQDGIKRVGPIENPLTGLFEINEFATYAIFEIGVEEVSIPQACFTFNPDGFRVEIDGNVDFDGSCSNDPSAYDIVQWEWDWDWDGDPASFTADDTTATPTITHDFTIGGGFLVGLRVTNDAPSPVTSEIFSDTVTAHGWILPPHKLTTSDALYSDLWWCSDLRIATTSDGYAHAIVETTYTGYATRVDYYMCDTEGLVSTEVLWNGYPSDIGLIITDSDEIYAFAQISGDIRYRKKNASSWDAEVLCMTHTSGMSTDHGAYAINPDGDILVMMEEYGSCPIPDNIVFSVNEGSGFSPGQVIATVDRWTACSGGGGSGYITTVNACADLDGTFYMAWDGLVAFANSNRDIWYATYDGTVSGVQYIATGPAQEFFPILRVDADNNVWCGYRGGSGNYVAIKQHGNTSFDPGFLIDPLPANNFSFDINPNTGAVLYMVNQRDTSINNEYHNWCKMFNTSDSASTILNSYKWRLDETVVTRNWWPNVSYGKDGHWYALWDDQRDLGAPQSLGHVYYGAYW